MPSVRDCIDDREDRERALLAGDFFPAALFDQNVAKLADTRL
jgi:hypothetical protein